MKDMLPYSNLCGKLLMSNSSRNISSSIAVQLYKSIARERATIGKDENYCEQYFKDLSTSDMLEDNHFACLNFAKTRAKAKNVNAHKTAFDEIEDEPETF